MKPAPEGPGQAPGILAWFARNHVAANLLMVAVVATGLLVARHIRQEIYPTFVLDVVRISMEYRGASPDEVEHSIILPIESELRSMEVIREVRSVASEGSASISAELVPGTDRNRGLQEITAAVQRISLFPDDAEPPVISLDGGRRRGVMYLSLYGDLDQRGLVAYARQIEEALLAEPDISLVEIRGMRRPEVQIEITQARLRSLGLRLEDVAEAIDASALDVPAGSIKTPGGNVLLKTAERRNLAQEFQDIAILSRADGTKIRLGDIAEVREDFEESDTERYFDGRPSIYLGVYSSESQSPLTVARAVRRFLDRELPHLPPSVGMTVTYDRSRSYEERIQMLMTNGALGLMLVVLALGLFLELRVAFWTAAGIPVSILGSLFLLPAMDASINMISLFGFIVTLGIVVDDAVVVGEDIFHKMSEGMSRMDAAVAGVKAMTVPVVFAVSTNIIAFVPLLFVPGATGQFFYVLPAVVIAVFTVSLIECLFILPAHLAYHGKRVHFPWFARFNDWQTRLRIRIDDAIDRWYSPVVRTVIRHRYLTGAMFLAALILVIAYTFSGRVNFAFRPSIETPFIQAEIEMPSGTPVARTREVVFQIEQAARNALEENGETNILVGISCGIAERSASEGEVSVRLVEQSQRKITGARFASLWREAIGDIPDLESLFFDYLIGPGGSAEIDIQLSHPEVEVLRQAATEVAAAIEGYPGVEDVRKGFGSEMPQFNFEIKPAGRSLGLDARQLGRQIRHAFYGAEALRQPRDRDELRVMVRLPREERNSLGALEDLLIRAPGGGQIPLKQAARVIRTEAPVRIERVDGARVHNVTANVVPGVTTGNKVLAAFSEAALPEILARHPGLRCSFEGEQREQRESMLSLTWGLVAALFAIYGIMAALLRSYVQAFIVLLMIPWSLAGAVMGHVVMGYDLSVFSIFGMLALCGMVVNGAFVMAVTRNEYQQEGTPATEAIRRAAQRRFRPILLTALTTFLGLAPMILETSLQALFLVPMAIALGIGTLVSCFVVMTFIPAMMVVAEDLSLENLTPAAQAAQTEAGLGTVP
ncbi:MAG: efflux RND transporter permease subunit [Verrucomicrobiales bacterium]|nr:efflux RND transporter permease subunit [Verrucomicrobiales bacterium]